MGIKDNVRKILCELPSGVQLVVVGKGRSGAELMEAIEGGAKIIGENYVQEAAEAQKLISDMVQWHFIGHLQKNKVKRAVEIFNMIETVDSIELACEIDKRSGQIDKIMPVLIEVNSGREPKKSGVMPEAAEGLARAISILPHLRLMGLMTIGTPSTNPEESRPCFSSIRRLSEDIKQLDLHNSDMEYISMGMTDSYHIAVEESANLVRIGRGIFG